MSIQSGFCSSSDNIVTHISNLPLLGYVLRLEMLGHSLALMLKQQGKEKRRLESMTNSSQGISSCTTNHNCAHDNPSVGLRSKRIERKAPLIAIIVPATSNGVSAKNLNHLPLAASLLPSLYQTRSEGFQYRVYLAVNENDPIYNDHVLTHTIFDVAYNVAKEKYFSSLNVSEFNSLRNLNYARISHRIILVPDSMLPKRALSALFNIPTLIAAYTDSCDYFYVVNDDLFLKSSHWTEKLIEPLDTNPVYRGLGVSGGIDVSDSITPQIEFPFFSRTHVELFPWCGCNPWIFKNWWEDNWLTDIYLPFDSVFYRHDVVVENYIGIEVKVATTTKVGAADPSYVVTEGRRTPFFYVEEVEKARSRIKGLLNSYIHSKGDANTSRQASDSDDLGEIPKVLEYEEHAIDMSNDVSEDVKTDIEEHTDMGVITSETRAAVSRSTSYCDGIMERTPSLLTMPVAAHEYVLDPCNAHLKVPEHRKFVAEVHSVAIPHSSYAELLSESEQAHAEGTMHSTVFESERKKSVDICSHYYKTLDHFKRKSSFNRLDDLDDDIFQDWEACVKAVGFDKLFLLKAMQKYALCKVNPHSATQGGQQSPSFEYDSCDSSRHLKVLILHNHAPLFTRYGSDKRLYHIAETLVGLGHDVVFGGSFVSDLETADDHTRLRHIDAKLYSPLAKDSGDRNGINVDEYAFTSMFRKEQPDVVFMTLWFWNTPPETILYMDIINRLAPSVPIAVLSDDAHTLREEMLLSKEKISNNNINLPALSLLGKDEMERKEARESQDIAVEQAKSFRTFRQIRVLEYLAYAKADVILTITENDREKILRTKTDITPEAVPHIDRGKYARGPEPDREKDVSTFT